MNTTKKVALAILLGHAYTHHAFAQTDGSSVKTLPEVQVAAQPPDSGSQADAWSPNRILMGDDLRNRMSSSLGETLGNEAGVATSGFGAAAARPIIRGLDGSRVKILQNGMSVMDVSTLSQDHAVGVSTSNSRQVEIVRGPRALIYGSGIIGGTVNVINDRIPTGLAGRPSGEAELRLGSVDSSSNGSVSVDGSAGKIGLHVDASAQNAGDYRIPGYRIRNDQASAQGRLPQTYSRQQSLGAGGAYIGQWGHAGLSVTSLANQYGVPTPEGANIELEQQRIDFDTLWRNPSPAFESFQLRLGYTDYRHTEFDIARVPETTFSNRAWESRMDWQHRPIAGWRGRFGLQTEDGSFTARSASNGAPGTIEPTRSSTLAAFITEEKDFGALKLSAGARLESVERRPATLAPRSFQLGSLSAGALWTVAPGYGVGATLTRTQRAPGIEELYSNGPHHATETFDRGQAKLQKETSRALELSLQKTSGLVRWKANLFHTRIDNFIYGALTGQQLDQDGLPGGDLNERISSQAPASLHGAELEGSYNADGPGLSLRGFADTSRGRFTNAGNLPLQPASRVGLEAAYRQGPWQGGLSILRALAQQRLASFETSATPGHTRIDASLAYTHRIGQQPWTAFLLGRNLLNEDIRMATSLLKDAAPQAGRSIIIGLRTRF